MLKLGGVRDVVGTAAVLTAVVLLGCPQASAETLEEALAYEPTAEELGEAVVDLTGDVTPQSAPPFPESSSPL